MAAHVRRRDSIFHFDEETTGNRFACEAYMEGIHVGFDRRICTDASSKPLPIADLSADFSSPWHKSDGQNCVAPAMERFSSEFWCGGRRNTRVFQGRQAGNHRKLPMSGGTDPFHVCPCFLFVLLFRSQGAFSRGENEFIIKKCAALLRRKWIYYKKVRGAALAKRIY